MHHITGFTHQSSQYQSLILSKRKTVIPDLKALCREDPVRTLRPCAYSCISVPLGASLTLYSCSLKLQITAHDALKALINLSGDPRVHPDLDDDKFIKHICLLITVRHILRSLPIRDGMLLTVSLMYLLYRFQSLFWQMLHACFCLT